MRMIVDLKKHHHVVEVGMLLAVIALAVGIAGCDGGGNNSYTLTITSTAGGSVTTPGQGIFTFDEGTVVNLVATADDGYGFQRWTGDTEGIADPGSRTTTMVMGRNSSIVANFGPDGPPGPGTP